MNSDDGVSEIDKVEKSIERLKDSGKRYFYGMSLSRELKDQIHSRFTKGYIVESKKCPRGLWDVIVQIL